jgi:hypothetical protein
MIFSNNFSPMKSGDRQRFIRPLPKQSTICPVQIPVSQAPLVYFPLDDSSGCIIRKFRQIVGAVDSSTPIIDGRKSPED